MSATNSIPVSEELYRELTQRAEETGVSPQDWAASVLEARIRIERETDRFFDARAARASSLTLGELLDRAGNNNPPDPGDELPEGYVPFSKR